MSRPPSPPAALSVALREARRQRGVSIATLAAEAGVSPRLISEFEQGKRPNVSLETAFRLLGLVGVAVRVETVENGEASAEQARAARAAHRRATWTGVKSTLRDQTDPAAPADAAARLGAVARVSMTVSALHRAPRTMTP